MNSSSPDRREQIIEKLRDAFQAAHALGLVIEDSNGRAVRWDSLVLRDRTARRVGRRPQMGFRRARSR